MLKNYFKTTLRSLLRNRLYSIINIVGLSVGITSCIVLTLYVQFELSYDKHIPNADRVYRMAIDLEANNWAISYFPAGRLLQDNFPEVESFTRFKPVEPYISQNGVDNLVSEKIFYADSTVFDIMNIPLLQGTPETVFNDANSIVLTRKKAKQFFGDTDPIGKTLTTQSGEQTYMVTGIIEEPVSATHAHLEMIASSNAFAPMRPEFENGWNYLTNHYTYLRLNEHTNPIEFAETITKFIYDHLEIPEDQRTDVIRLQPVLDIHLYSDRGLEVEANGNVRNVYIFSIVAFFILLIACINFMNLTTAQSLKRAKEIGIRKVVGSKKEHLIFQFLSESVIISFIALILAFVFLTFIIPIFNEVTQKSLTIDPQENPSILMLFCGLSLFVGLISGVYPAFFLSSFSPNKVLKGKFATNITGQYVRKTLVVFQFAIAFIIIVGTYIVQDQLSFMMNKDLGFDKERLLILKMPSDSVGIATLKTELLRLPEVQSATKFAEKPGYMVRTSGLWREGIDDEQAENIYLFSGDADMMNTLDLNLKEGQFFREESERYYKEFVLNEAAVKKYGWTKEEAVGKMMDFGQRSDDPGVVIGVIEDFHFKHLESAIDPLVMFKGPDQNFEGRFLALKLSTDDLQNALEKVETTWAGFVPAHPFNYEFMDESFDKLFKQEQDLLKLFALFAGLAIFISCLGLFGLASFSIEQSKKSFAIRKVLGASTFGLLNFFSKEFLKLVGIGILVASPLAWYIMQQWLNNFAFHVSIKYHIFLVAAGSAILISVVTISFHSLKAALANPVKSLKDE